MYPAVKKTPKKLNSNGAAMRSVCPVIPRYIVAAKPVRIHGIRNQTTALFVFSVIVNVLLLTRFGFDGAWVTPYGQKCARYRYCDTD